MSGRMGDLLDRIDSSRPGSSGLLSLSDHITVHLVSIRGTRYISGFDNGKQMLGHSSERHERFLVSVPLQVNEIKLTIGLYGIRRIKFCGPSGSSEWVEDDVLTRSEGSTWTGALRSTQIALMLSWDDLRINGLTNTQDDSERFGDCFLWDHDPPDLAVNELSPNTFHEHDSVLDPSQSIRGFPGWRLMRYLPLVDKGSTLYGLTMFCVRAGGIVGIAAHFRSPHTDRTHMVGFQEGFPIHFRMMEGEHITHVYIHCFGARIFAPFILVKTNKSRSCYFGPAVDPSHWMFKLLVSPSSGRVSGLYYDVLKARQGMISSIGFTCHSMKPPKPDIHDHPEPLLMKYTYPRYSGFSLSIFRSEARLRNVRIIEMCHFGDRCTGLLIHYMDRTARVLGQWFESSEASHKVLFDSTQHGLFRKLQFRMTGRDKNGLVQDVILNDDHADTTFCIDVEYD
ncbi:MAG: hypothetical protein M1835_001660, partial [Candelina submexicana]